MRTKLRIYCVEGHWDYGKREIEPSVEPMLQLLRSLDLWPYARRDCATVEEMKFFLKAEWARCDYGSILYFATHGRPGEVYLSDDHAVTLGQLAVYLDGQCEDCLIDFGGCRVMEASEQALRDFVSKTSAMGVSGYTAEAGWTSALDTNGRPGPPTPGAPALALELLLFSTIRTQGINPTERQALQQT